MTFYATAPADMLKWGLPPGQPLMLSVASFTSWRKRWTSMPALPSCQLEGHEVAVDSGGYVAMRKGGYDYDLLAYLKWLEKVRPLWAALPDLCNEPEFAPTPEHRKIRVATSFIWGMMLWRHTQDAPWAWVPTVQGYTVDEYVSSARQMVSQVRWMREAYTGDRWIGDPTAFDAFPDPYFQQMRQAYGRVVRPGPAHARGFRVGIGSLCVRKDEGWMERVDQIIEAVAAELPDVGFHLWGISLNYLKTRAGRLHPRIVSTDSSAFNRRFGSDIPRLEERYRRTCRECLGWMTDQMILPRKCPICGGSWGLGQREFAMRVLLPEYAATAERYLSAPRQHRLAA
jgi:hypothetical protein